jgi:tetratricopeptide (TPR) repeat protein
MNRLEASPIGSGIGGVSLAAPNATTAGAEVAKNPGLASEGLLSVALKAKISQALVEARPDATESTRKSYLEGCAGDLIGIRKAITLLVGKAEDGLPTASQIRVLIEHAELGSADRLLAQIETSRKTAAQKGDVRYVRGSVALLGGDLPVAAAHFSTACRHLYAHAPDVACALRNTAASKLYAIARLIGIYHDLPISLFKANLEFWRREWQPDKWAMTQVNLANALFLQASARPPEGRDVLLEEAAGYFREALGIYSETAHRREWTMAQSSFAALLAAQARRCSGPAAAALHAEAVAAYQAALSTTDRRARPLRWAADKGQLAAALSKQVEGSASHEKLALLHESEKAGTDALTVYSTRVAPLHRISGQNGIANVLRGQAAQAAPQEAQRLLSRATATYREALAACPALTRPREWSTLQHNLALTLLDQARLARGFGAEGLLADAATAAHDALSCRDARFQRIQWISTQLLLGDISLMRARIGSDLEGARHIGDAIGAFRAIISECSEDMSPSQNIEILIRLAGTHEEAARISPPFEMKAEFAAALTSLEEAIAIAHRAHLSGHVKRAQSLRHRIKLRLAYAA